MISKRFPFPSILLQSACRQIIVSTINKGKFELCRIPYCILTCVVIMSKLALLNVALGPKNALYILRRMYEPRPS